MKILSIIPFKQNVKYANNKCDKNVSFGHNVKSLNKFPLIHADVVVTHACNKGCPTCIDKYVNQFKDIVPFELVLRFFNLLQEKTYVVKDVANPKGKTAILLLGGEPTVAGSGYLNKVAEDGHKRDFLMWISTNGIKLKTVDDILPNFDYVQITCDTAEQAEKWANSKYLDKINIKFPCTANTSLNDFYRFRNATKNFPHKSMIVYHDKNCIEASLQPELASVLNNSEIEYTATPAGIYRYGNIDGITIKRIVKGDSIFGECPAIPKLYPNGNYNCTWENELNNPYLGEL